MNLVVSCSNDSKTSTISKITPNPRGTKEEQIAYHYVQIHKYEIEIQKEDQYTYQHLRYQKSMNDVRASYNRRQQYVKKIDKHMREINRLQEIKEGISSS